MTLDGLGNFKLLNYFQRSLVSLPFKWYEIHLQSDHALHSSLRKECANYTLSPLHRIAVLHFLPHKP